MKLLIFNHFLPIRTGTYYYSSFNVFLEHELGELAQDCTIEKERRLGDVT